MFGKIFFIIRLICSIILIRFNDSEVTQGANRLLRLVLLETCLESMLSNQLNHNLVMRLTLPKL